MNLIGKMLDNRYEILEKIGSGGMATVFKAKDKVLNRFVAIKVLRDEFTTDSEFIKRFKSEAQAAASLNHANIVSIYDVKNEENLYYIVMELIQGKTLKEIINEEGALPCKWSIDIAMQICSALEMAHKHDIIHRDIKPHNIIITEDGVAKVTDFGIAKAVSNSTITAFGTTIGSVHYFSPEHARGGFTDAKSDIYSLGVVLYEMLTGKVPFEADTPVSVALKQVQEEPTEPIKLNPDIPQGVNDIIMKAMEKEPSLRYQSAKEMNKDLKQVLTNPSASVGDKGKIEDLPTQNIPVIKDDDDDDEYEEIELSGFRLFLYEHKVVKVLLIILALIVLFFTIMFATIKIIGASKPKEAQMVNVVYTSDGTTRMTKDAAQKLLENAGFTNVTFEEEYSDDIEAGYVISQSPAFQDGYSIHLNEPIVVKVSKGAQQATLPDKIVGEKIDAIRAKLDELQIKYQITEEKNEEQEMGTILAVVPDAGTTISLATTVQLKVSGGSAFKDVQMVDVVGKSETDAKAALTAAGFTNVTVSYTDNKSKSNNSVIKQSVEPGTVVKENTNIVITVNQWPEDHTLSIKVSLKSKAKAAEEDTNTTATDKDKDKDTTKTKSQKIKIVVDGNNVKEETVAVGGTVSATYSGTGRVKIEITRDGGHYDSKTVDLTSQDVTETFSYEVE